MMNYSKDNKTNNTYKGNEYRVESCIQVKKREFSPLIKRGDVFWADLSQTRGSEQAGIRPVVVIQNDMGNKHSSCVIAMSITSNIQKGKLPTHIEVGKEQGLERPSVVLGEQIRTIDKSRLQEKITRFDDNTMAEINKALMVSVGLL